MALQFTIFDRFGGVSALARALGEPATTVQSWKSSGRIPAARQSVVLSCARELGIDISAEDVVFPLGVPEEFAASCTDHKPATAVQSSGSEVNPAPEKHKEQQ